MDPGGTYATWPRLVPHARTTDLDVGLAAEIADPLWMVGRQLQLGELTGVDGGTPIIVEAQASFSRFAELRLSRGDAIPLTAASPPLEMLVEAQPMLPTDDSSTRWSVRVRAGRDLRRRLVAAGLGAVADALAGHAATTFAPAAEAPDDVEAARTRALLAGRCIDGGRVFGLATGAGLPADVLAGLEAGQRAELDATVAAWRAAMRVWWGVAEAESGEASGWVDERLAHSFSITAPPLPPSEQHFEGDDAAIVLRATHDDGTGLDWYSLDRVDPETVAPGPAGTPGSRKRARVLATPLTFRGAPADRFWEFEDAASSLGFGSAGVTDLVRLVATEFAVVYSTDWLVVPLQLPTGSVATVDWVIVRDTFGEATLVGDRATPPRGSGGRQFQPADAATGEGDFPLLVVLPSALAAVRSPVRERVSVQRDDVAAVAWAIEHTVEGPLGRGVDRPVTLAPEDAVATVVADEFELLWRLATPVPDAWIPFVPDDDDRGPVLRRARLFDSVDDAPRPAASRLLASLTTVRDEEVTASGVEVTTLDQLVRTTEGAVVVWRGRERHVGRGGAASRLRYDDTSPV